MAPNEDRIFHVKCQNMYEGDLSADALGITSCLYAYSHLSFSHGHRPGVRAALSPAARVHGGPPGVRAILGATD